MEQSIRQRCIEFSVKLAEQLRSLLPSNLNVIKMTKVISVGEAFKVLKPFIVGFSLELGFSNDMDSLVTHNENLIRELVSLRFSVPSFPYSNADVERIFNQANIVKSKLTNRMLAQTLNAILLVRFDLKQLVVIRTNFRRAYLH
ncbi:hypothetical protein PR048_029327 [Dryococelus australis]|uniref:Uncharacterized protein n=1 Tax=Dryococelus australis TaxID=614101 RepID=A0ABQ9GD50_9NEOP|nr:hypothetical protein PR048_029327 [Dryococelus australis]